MARNPRSAASIAARKGAATRAANFAKLTPKQQAVVRAQRHAAGIKGAHTRAVNVAAYQKTHHGQLPPRKVRKLASPLSVYSSQTGNRVRSNDFWLLGRNDIVGCCAVVAIANSLLWMTGQRVEDDELCWLSCILSDVSIVTCLETLTTTGLAGCRPKRYDLVDSVDLLTPKHSGQASWVLGIQLEQAQRVQTTWDHESSPAWDAHAALLVDETIVTWGTTVRTTEQFILGQVEEVWAIEW